MVCVRLNGSSSVEPFVTAQGTGPGGAGRVMGTAPTVASLGSGKAPASFELRPEKKGKQLAWTNRNVLFAVCASCGCQGIGSQS